MFKKNDVKTGLAFIDYMVYIFSVPIIYLLSYVHSHTHTHKHAHIHIGLHKSLAIFLIFCPKFEFKLGLWKAEVFGMELSGFNV